MNTPVGGSLRVAPSPLAGGGACGPAKPIPRPLLAGEAGLAAPAERSKITSSTNAIFPPGRPKEKTAPSEGNAVHEVTSVGAMS